MNIAINRAVLIVVVFLLVLGFCYGKSLTPSFAEGPSTSQSLANTTVGSTVLDGTAKSYSKNSVVEVSGVISGGQRKVDIKQYDFTLKKWIVIKSVDSNSSGRFSYSIKLSSSSVYLITAPSTYTHKAFVGKSTTLNVENVATKLTVKTLDGKKKFYKKGSVVNVSGTVNGGARTVSISKYNTKTKKWDVVVSGKSNSKGVYSINLTVNSSGKYAVYAPYVSGFNGVYGVSTELTVNNSKPSVTNSKVEHTRMVPWGKNNIRGYISGSELPTNIHYSLTVQEKVGKTWKDVATYKKSGLGSYSLPLNKGTTKSSSATKNYRVKISGAGLTTVYSSQVSVIWDNPYKGSTREKKVYGYTKKYCPDTPIEIRAIASQGKWGSAELGTKNTIVVDSKMPEKHLKTVSLHECAHFVQWKQYGNDWTKFTNDMNKVYGQKGSRGMEQNADCIANYWSKNTYWGYGQNCVGKKGTVAKAVATNKKY